MNQHIKFFSGRASEAKPAFLADLHADLQPYVCRNHLTGGFGLWHPLVTDIHIIGPDFVALANTTYARKLASLRKYKLERKWEAYVFVHSRGYRLDALQYLVENETLNEEEYWGLVRSVWEDSERISEYRDAWWSFWNAPIRRRYLTMTSQERRIRRELPKKVRVWRGFARNGGEYGWSWSLNRDKASWFAYRSKHDGSPKLASTIVRARASYAYLDGRNEEELVLDSDALGDIDIQELDLAKNPGRSFAELFPSNTGPNPPDGVVDDAPAVDLSFLKEHKG